MVKLCARGLRAVCVGYKSLPLVAHKAKRMKQMKSRNNKRNTRVAESVIVLRAAFSTKKEDKNRKVK